MSADKPWSALTGNCTSKLSEAGFLRARLLHHSEGLVGGQMWTDLKAAGGKTPSSEASESLWKARAPGPLQTSGKGFSPPPHWRNASQPGLRSRTYADGQGKHRGTQLGRTMGPWGAVKSPDESCVKSSVGPCAMTQDSLPKIHDDMLLNRRKQGCSLKTRDHTAAS